MPLYSYTPPNLQDIRSMDEEDYQVVCFPTPYQSAQNPKDRVFLHLFSPPPGCPVKGDIVFLHGIGDGNIPHLQWYARRFRSKGYRTAFLILPFHGERALPGVKGGEPFYSLEPDTCVVLFHQAAKDVRASVDFLQQQPGFDAGKLFLVGVSFGGIIGTIALGLEKRFQKASLLITGGNWRWINFHSPAPYGLKMRPENLQAVNRYGCQNEHDCVTRYRQDPVDWVKKNVRSVEDIFTRAPIPCYAYDSLSFAPLVTQPLLFIRGRFDRLIPRQATEELLELLPHKTVVSIPAGHKSSILFKRRIARNILRFFEKTENCPPWDRRTPVRLIRP
ncbi:MAG TPA: alpha/beta fold hydrolase [Thermotogota bacterium]|nr:alpha/beta fold hydrolase [Thermotogota bacterium]HRW93217.1 alpha/beta fold hydrolase [Thermotogota bacterium]